MTYELKKLTPEDGRDVFDMLKEIGENENGFANPVNTMSYDEYRAWLVRRDDESRGVLDQSWKVPQTTYWLYANGAPVAIGKLRHRLTDRLLIEGGHIGYGVRASARGNGHATALLELMLQKARAMGIEKILITVREDNPASAKVAEKSGGALEKREGGRLYYWIELG